MMLKKSLVAGSVVAALSGCAAPIHMSKDTGSAGVDKAAQDIRTADNWVPKYINDEDAEKKVLEVYGRLLPSATKLCRQLAEDECGWDIRYSSDPDLNAFAAGESAVVIQKGVLRHAENDDEVAMIIAHELSHHAANHIEEKKQNAATGALAGTIIMGALLGVANSGAAYSSYQMNAITSAGQMGANAGSLSFSKEQESEADYLAAYIIKQGGYDLHKARRLWVKLGRLGSTEHGERLSFNTHPDPAERLARMDATIKEIDANGGVLPAPSPERNKAASGGRSDHMTAFR